MEGLFLPFHGVVDFVFLRREELCSEAGGAGAVMVFVSVGFDGDFAVFFGGWEGVVADAAGPVFGGRSGHGFFL